MGFEPMISPVTGECLKPLGQQTVWLKPIFFTLSREPLVFRHSRTKPMVLGVRGRNQTAVLIGLQPIALSS
jgi:hypothetical protein